MNQTFLFEPPALPSPRAFDIPPATAPLVPLNPACVPAISLWSPWGALVALGEKKIETRCWPVAYRGWMAICSTASHTPDGIAAMNLPPIKAALDRHGLTAISMPLGSVLCMVRLVRCEKTETLIKTVGEPEIHFGNYGPRRYGWVFDRIVRLPAPVPVKGKQRIWKWTPGLDIQIWIGENCD